MQPCSLAALQPLKPLYSTALQYCVEVLCCLKTFNFSFSVVALIQFFYLPPNDNGRGVACCSCVRTFTFHAVTAAKRRSYVDYNRGVACCSCTRTFTFHAVTAAKRGSYVDCENGHGQTQSRSPIHSARCTYQANAATVSYFYGTVQERTAPA